MCQTDPPNKSAKMSCHENLPDPPARMTRQIYLPEIPPSLLKIPRQNMARQPPPPPPPAPPTEQGGGGKESTRPACVHWTGTFTFLMNDYIFLYNTIHTYSTQSGLDKVYKYIAVGERIVARRGWGAGLLPAPLKGVFCIIWILQEVSRRAIPTRIGYENMYNIPLYSNEYISA